MSDDHFNYDQLMLDAHRELIRNVLARVARTGLPGDHHFFIIFRTSHEGTRISDRLRAQYPEEMTIVLQHQYSNLKVHDDRFEIQLSFNRIPELLVIPFAAITGFVDPSVPFGLQLAGESAAGLENSIGMLVPGLPRSPLEGETGKGHQPAKAEQETPLAPSSDFEAHEESESVTSLWESEETSVPSIFPAGVETGKNNGIEHKSPVSDHENSETEKPFDEEPEEDMSTNIVQLDAFRKKSK